MEVPVAIVIGLMILSLIFACALLAGPACFKTPRYGDTELIVCWREDNDQTTNDQVQ